MRMKRERGDALILVLLILGLGALMVVPAHHLTATSLKSSQTATEQVEELFAADAAQEFILWGLLHDDWASQLTADGQGTSTSITVNGVSIDVTLILRALVAGWEESGGGTPLATDHAIYPTKSVSPNAHTFGHQTYTYTITLDHISSDTTQGLDAVYDILPSGFDEDSSYIPGSSCLSVGGGACDPIPDPSETEEEDRVALRWPATGNFSSPIRDFQPGQVKELSFQVADTLADNKVHCNAVFLKPWNTLNTALAPISVGNPSSTACHKGGLVVEKTTDPEPIIIQSGVEETITYTISLTNQDNHTHQVEKITDYLPPGFTYCGFIDGCSSPSGVTTADPTLLLETVNGVLRWRLEWGILQFPNGQEVPVKKAETKTLTFQAKTTQFVSGSYYNEVFVKTDDEMPEAFEDFGIPLDAWQTSYTVDRQR